MYTTVTLVAQLMAASPAARTALASPALARTSGPPASSSLARSGGIPWDALRWAADTGRVRRRAKAIEYGSFYQTRVTLHRYLSFAMVPLFIGSYVTGDRILEKSTDAPKWARDLHRPFATATAVVFSLNTVTGLWNLWDSRKDPAGRTKRYIHSLLFLAADAGFFYAGTRLAEDAENSDAIRREHRTVALASMGVSVTSWAMMLFFK